MSALTFSVVPVMKSDLPAIAHLVHTCKLALPINRLLFENWPNDAAQKPLYTAAVNSSFDDDAVQCWKAVDDETGGLVGYIATTRKRPENIEAQDHEMRENKKPTVPDGLKAEVMAAVSDATSQIARTLVDVDHFGKLANSPGVLTMLTKQWNSCISA